MDLFWAAGTAKSRSRKHQTGAEWGRYSSVWADTHRIRRHGLWHASAGLWGPNNCDKNIIIIKKNATKTGRPQRPLGRPQEPLERPEAWISSFPAGFQAAGAAWKPGPENIKSDLSSNTCVVCVVRSMYTFVIPVHYNVESDISANRSLSWALVARP